MTQETADESRHIVPATAREHIISLGALVVRRVWFGVLKRLPTPFEWLWQTLASGTTSRMAR